ncbi:LOW QUALITY PROTEIN: NADPH--cytochrome P450 reductase-like [Enhydra lutris kenyoni]|uniref:NADPH--hemoprotein reductase n=1 Tax=Enhydra lutris kenyoni TaxID=391180 RepID=A0A2Y9K2N0_ENHLU|nr:LOW QUALITY PROTEIN: NADPH--cytochrome P450 reductase-like [Enhydra lutris kenyoni]
MEYVVRALPRARPPVNAQETFLTGRPGQLPGATPGAGISAHKQSIIHSPSSAFPPLRGPPGPAPRLASSLAAMLTLGPQNTPPSPLSSNVFLICPEQSPRSVFPAGANQLGPRAWARTEEIGLQGTCPAHVAGLGRVLQAYGAAPGCRESASADRAAGLGLVALREALVSQLGEILGAELDVIMSLNNLDEESNKKHPFPCPTSYRTALTYYLDITNPPPTNVLYELAPYASEPSQQEQLRKMASSSGEGKELYLSWVVEARRHILAILQDFPSLRPPIDHLCELLPRLQARYYSVASSSKVHPNSLHICAVAVEYETEAGRVDKGVATSWLRAKEPAGENGRRALVPMFVRKSQFRLPFKATTPVIMVGPGTGVAPFIGFIQERAWLRQQGKEVGETLLYYGCRRADEDYLYREELAGFQKDGSLTQLSVAFSREQPHKVYVQHLLRRDKEHLWRLIHEAGAHIYVCGDARNMARDVQNIFYDIVADGGAVEHAQAVDYVKKLMTKGCYSLDVWS